MKRVLMSMALAMFVATPAMAQYFGMPMWNSPKGGTGVTLSADYAKPSDGWGNGSAFGARASMGLANLTLTAGLSSWEPQGAVDGFSSIGGNAAFRVIGGSLLPVALNIQVGGARVGEANGLPTLTRMTAGVGISTAVPTPGVSVEPYLSLTNRWYKYSGFTNVDSNFGWTLGANFSFGMFGVHVAYDNESGNGTSGGVFGLGGHVMLRAPMGL